MSLGSIVYIGLLVGICLYVVDGVVRRICQCIEKCNAAKWCAEGCAWCQGENYDAADTNTIYQRSTAICKMHKARVRANNYYWNKLYRKLESEDECDRSGTGKNESNDINS